MQQHLICWEPELIAFGLNSTNTTENSRLTKRMWIQLTLITYWIVSKIIPYIFRGLLLLDCLERKTCCDNQLLCSSAGDMFAALDGRLNPTNRRAEEVRLLYNCALHNVANRVSGGLRKKRSRSTSWPTALDWRLAPSTLISPFIWWGTCVGWKPDGALRMPSTPASK